MHSFQMNGEQWRVAYVPPDSQELVDRTGKRCLATTDVQTHHIYVTNDICGEMLKRVLIHELGHCALWSYGLIFDIHNIVQPEYWVDAEEWACNFIADYGMTILRSANKILGDNDIFVVPIKIDNYLGGNENGTYI